MIGAALLVVYYPFSNAKEKEPGAAKQGDPNPGKFVSIFERFEKLCFVGHTHVPGIFLEGPDFYSPDELDYKFELSDEKAIVNVGSVGQPRDRDPRSSFVIVTDTAIEFIRLPYDVDTTVKKVEAIPELDNFLGTRLLDGR